MLVEEKNKIRNRASERRYVGLPTRISTNISLLRSFSLPLFDFYQYFVPLGLGLYNSSVIVFGY
jgi:hypothetical protein